MRLPEKTELSTLDDTYFERFYVLALESIQNGMQKFGKIDALVNNAAVSPKVYHSLFQSIEIS